MRTFLFVATLAGLFAFGQPAHAQIALNTIKADLRSPNKNTVCANYGAPFMYQGAAYWDAFPAMLQCTDISSKKKCQVSLRISALAPVWYGDVNFEGYSFEFPGMEVTDMSVNATTVSAFGQSRLSHNDSRAFVDMADLWMDNDPFQDSVTITVTLRRTVHAASFDTVDELRTP